jgi:hypothetical protein
VRLLGAYHLEGHPLDQRRLLVETELPLDVAIGVFVGGGESKLTAYISAEEIATRAFGEGMFRVVRGRGEETSEASADVTFTGDDGRHYVLALTAPFGWHGIRGLTEIQGTLTRVPGTIAVARLRIDWRAAFRGA